MATQTTTLHLNKPAYTEAADIAVVNGNMDTIDTWATSTNQSIGNLSNLTTTEKGSLVGAANELNSNVTNKLNGTNGTNNNGIELRNSANVATCIFKAKTPSASTPSVWMDINASTKVITFYKDIGSGWVTFGTVSIS